jgi:hypothetical protein
MSDAPGWHARHLHAMLDDPELFGGSKVGSTPKLRRARDKGRG